MKISYRYRFYPSVEQELALRNTIGCCRFVYNRALALKRQLWTDSQTSLSGFDLIKQITLWKKEEGMEWLSAPANACLQQSIHNLSLAFQNFFAKRNAYPQFKRKSAGGSCRFTYAAFRLKFGDLHLGKIPGSIGVVWHRELPDKSPKQCTVRLTPSGKWFISFLCEVEKERLPAVEKSVGIDLGITALVTTSEGEKTTNPKPYRKFRKRLATAQRHYARKVKGSQNQKKSAKTAACINEKIANIRKDHLHKLTTRLIRENQTIVMEDLAVRNMMKNHNLAGAISDSGWNILKSQLEYKCRWYGKELRFVDRWFPSSKTCHSCGHVVEKLPLNIREWTCTKCGAVHDRDINAAKNILSAGSVDHTGGETVRPKRGNASRRVSMKQVKLRSNLKNKITSQATTVAHNVVS